MTSLEVKRFYGERGSLVEREETGMFLRDTETDRKEGLF